MGIETLADENQMKNINKTNSRLLHMIAFGVSTFIMSCISGISIPVMLVLLLLLFLRAYSLFMAVGFLFVFYLIVYGMQLNQQLSQNLE